MEKLDEKYQFISCNQFSSIPYPHFNDESIFLTLLLPLNIIVYKTQREQNSLGDIYT